MKKSVIIVTSLMLLSGCSNSVKQSLGLVRSSPDEFKVVSQPDLILPPNFELMPPQYPVESYQFNVKKQNVTNSHLSKSESALLSKVALNNKDENIREIITNEQKHKDYTTDGKLAKKINSALKPDENKTKIVSAAEENERIQKNKSQGKKITEGDSKSITKQKSVVDKILGE